MHTHPPSKNILDTRVFPLILPGRWWIASNLVVQGRNERILREGLSRLVRVA
jgi:hypothetical protein